MQSCPFRPYEVINQIPVGSLAASGKTSAQGRGYQASLEPSSSTGTLTFLVLGQSHNVRKFLEGGVVIIAGQMGVGVQGYVLEKWLGEHLLVRGRRCHRGLDIAGSLP